ncbi:uridine kinase [Marinomonas algarum]|uniref:Uridine kinase n=1 Tax=Marinomonas algarum TaxID=2883105 RepID=A0A9X1ILS0_9GAMM|nr:uridine kinase [Marinomonas algarum]MCB5161555.1 uridine kinase [Marinomonas algarum]
MSQGKKGLIVAIGLVSAMSLSVSAFATEQASRKPQIASQAELFGLPFNDLNIETLEKQLSKMQVRRYPSYQECVAKYSLGDSGILGLTVATIYYNRFDFVTKTVLFGVVESKEKRQYLGDLLQRKYGLPDEGYLNQGIGKPTWEFDDGTSIRLHNTTYNVSVVYTDEEPLCESSDSGRIDVEALRKKR